VRVITERSQLTDRIAIAHFVSSFRRLIEYAPENGREDEVPVVVGMQPFPQCTGLGYLADGGRRLFAKVRRSLRSNLVNR
jgi:hypothetical protein